MCVCVRARAHHVGSDIHPRARGAAGKANFNGVLGVRVSGLGFRLKLISMVYMCWCGGACGGGGGACAKVGNESLYPASTPSLNP